MAEVRYDWQDCLCFDLGYQVCHHYENWCDEQAEIEWWDGLSQKEKDDYMTIVTSARPYEVYGKREIFGEEDWPF